MKINKKKVIDSVRKPSLKYTFQQYDLAGHNQLIPFTRGMLIKKLFFVKNKGFFLNSL